MKSITLLLLAAALLCGQATPANAQEKGLVNTSKSANARLWCTDIDAVEWTGGFWKDRFDVCRDTMILSMWETLSQTTHAYDNFLVASGTDPKDGRHHGPQFFDGDFYKWFEGMAAVYAVTKDPKYDRMMDEIIDVIARSQREDGYLHTPVIIMERLHPNDGRNDNTVVGTKTGNAEGGAFNDRLNFETYNHGHLMTAACVHYRATGKRTLLDVAIKATDFLCHFYETATAELARNAICPSHYMGVMEMYRVTGNPRYLELAKNMIEIRGMVENGTDDNQDRIPFRQQKEAMGHAVRANYLYAGAADVVAETGDRELMENLESIWTDIVTRKMYITGACGALYDGTSPDGTHYEPDYIQKVHQSYGRAYQLPNSTAHNETCANIGNMLFNWRMFGITGDAKYMNIVETVIYNSLLSGVSIDGKRYFYTNPMRMSKEFPYTMRWPKERTQNISCFCCPPNTMRTVCEVQDYAYAVSKEGVWVNLYGSNQCRTRLANGEQAAFEQRSNYPWEGSVDLVVKEAPKSPFSLFLYLPQGSGSVSLRVNGQADEALAASAMQAVQAGSGYVEINRRWRKGDRVELEMELPAQLIESNPLVEETRNQVAVKRGPIVYCLESGDIEGGAPIDNVSIPADARFTPEMIEIDGSPILALRTEADLIDNASWRGVLYRPVATAKRKVSIRLIPYYAWGNRGKMDMTVWMPLSR